MRHRVLFRKLVEEQKKFEESERHVSHIMNQQKRDAQKLAKENDEIKKRVSKRFENI